jgi:hypothetical protein
VAARRTEVGSATILPVWFSVDLWVVGLAYLVNWKTVFGKTPDGSLRIGHRIVMLPYLAFCWTVWHLQNLLSAEPIWNEVAPGFIVGRRCRFSQLPPGTSKVIDFTAEFAGDKATRRAVQWLIIPVLDGCAPDLKDYQTGFAFLGEPGESAIYLCCANGHGRSATFACALLMKLAKAPTPQAAVETVVSGRRRASLNGEQLRSLRRIGERSG